MNWKVGIMLCLLIFVAITVVNGLSTAVLSASLPTTTNVREYVALGSGSFIEPLGDPVDNDEAPM